MNHSLEFEFAKIIQKILLKHGYEIFEELKQYARPTFQGRLPDLVAGKDGKAYIIEIKIYRTHFVPPSLLLNAVETLATDLDECGGDYGICIVTAPIQRPRVKDRRLDDRIEIWDLTKLDELTIDSAELTLELSNFIRRAGIGTLVRDTPPQAVRNIEGRASEIETKDKGALLARLIENCPIGRNGANQFEKACENALRFLFDDQVGKWTPQKSASDGMHRYDLVARLAPTHDFWVGLSRDFRSRYVIFEFKNYSAKIGQDQIYTTEKYLFVTALRSVSIIISRKGADKNAERAIRGALREGGKLIINITSSDLCTMLISKDSGDDPTNVIVEKLDLLLTEIGR